MGIFTGNGEGFHMVGILAFHNLRGNGGKHTLPEYIMEAITKEYRDWLIELKARIHSSQIKAALSVNTELLNLYWHLGQEILEKEKNSAYGKKLIDQLSKDLLHEFPHIKGLSRSNLYHVRQWVMFYTRKGSIVPQLVRQLSGFGQITDNEQYNEETNGILSLLCKVPWGHNREIIAKCAKIDEALFYILESIKKNWSRNVLVHQIESKLWQRQGKAITNFTQTLPAPQSDLARELIKDPYSFDFLNLHKEHKERDLETALIDNLIRFLLELGAGFSFVGRQFPLKIGGKEFSVDLLFYHYKLRCFVVVELKGGEFMPEYSGKLNFYLNVIDDTLKHKDDNNTIGLLICRNRNEIVTEYALRGINNPIGVSQYQFTTNLPENLSECLPSIEQIEEKLSEVEKENMAENS